jgi:hypothetical protein
MTGIGRRTPAPSTPTPEAVVRRRPASAWPPSVDRVPLEGAEQPCPSPVGSLHDSSEARARALVGSSVARRESSSAAQGAVPEHPRRCLCRSLVNPVVCRCGTAAQADFLTSISGAETGGRYRIVV